MNNINLSDLLNTIDNPQIIKKWKEIASKDIKAFTKRTNPFNGVKVSNYYLYIDTKSRTYAITLQGVKPNFAHTRGFTAPVDKRKASDKPLHVHFEKGWRTVHTERTTSPSAGVGKPLDISYFGVTGKPTAFFGIRKGSSKEAFGLINNVAVPVYSETGFVEYITQDSQQDLEDILIDAGFSAINTFGG